MIMNRSGESMFEEYLRLYPMYKKKWWLYTEYHSDYLKLMRRKKLKETPPVIQSEEAVRVFWFVRFYRWFVKLVRSLWR